MTDVTEITWQEAFIKDWASDNIEWDGKILSKDQAIAQAKEKCELWQKIRVEVLNAAKGGKPLYVKLTQGQKAGTIARVDNFDFSMVMKAGPGGYRSDPIDPGKLTFNEADNRWRPTGTGVLEIVGRLYQYKTHKKEINLSVDGKVVHKFIPSTSSMTTCRPVVLLGYEGPEVLAKGQKPAKISATIQDRYGRDVTKGDLVIVGKATGGTLMVGKVDFITDRRAMTIKHIGAHEPMTLTNVQNEQVLKLTDDIKAVLMMEKLKSI